jgi:hypothetical protein
MEKDFYIRLMQQTLTLNVSDEKKAEMLATIIKVATKSDKLN